MSIYIEIDGAAMRRMTTSPTGMVGRDIYRRSQAVAARAKRNAPVRSGRLRSSIGVKIGTRNGEVVGRVGSSVNYARYVHDGTGLFGPKATRIQPKRSGGVLVFEGANGTVFAKSTAGMRGRPFMLDALKAAV